jgi:membrane protein implicated in regulation of membrane protease activity
VDVVYGILSTPWFWLILTVVFTLVELASAFNLITIWFAMSSFVMIFVSYLTGALSSPVRFKLHLALFLLMAVALLVFTRPIAVKKLRVGKVKTNVDDLIGRDALVVKGITKYTKGEVKIRGQIWTAISEADEEIADGAECVIVRIEGVKAVVKLKS